MKPGKVVNNGAFLLTDWKIQNRMSFAKNPHYWDADKVKLNTIDVLPIEDSNTAFAMYEVGAAHILTEVPTTIIPWLLKNRSEFICSPYLGTYYYRFNVLKAPMSNKNFRKALAYAVNREDIVKNVSKAGERPATGFCSTRVSRL